jgi:hypothetical protein
MNKEGYMGEAERRTRELRDPISLDLLKMAREYRMNVSFIGQYFQGFKDSDREVVFSWVMIHRPADLKKLERGVLRGGIIEFNEFAYINGHISNREVTFKKVFDGSDFTVIYHGSSKDGVSYEGTWRLHTSQEGDLKKEGRFSMRKVFDLEATMNAIEEAVAEEEEGNE